MHRTPTAKRNAFCRRARSNSTAAPVRGSAALREYADASTRVLHGQHMMLNHLYEVEGDHATGRATTLVSIATPSVTRSWGRVPTMMTSSSTTASGKFAIGVS